MLPYISKQLIRVNKLAIEFSSMIGSIALESNGAVHEINAKQPNQNQKLLQVDLPHLLKQQNVCFKDIDLIIWGIGPGSFTGIRLAASWVQSFAYGSNIPVYGVSSLKNIAYKAYKQTNKNQIIVSLDAKLSKFYVGQYVYHENSFNQMCSDYLADEAPNIDEATLHVGDQCSINPTPDANTAIILTNLDIQSGVFKKTSWKDLSPSYLNHQLYKKKGE
jgi:tRNA threonylcarbamoyl adenosine modification protein YeaZ